MGSHAIADVLFAHPRITIISEGAGGLTGEGTLLGGAGNDMLSGGISHDRLRGGAGRARGSLAISRIYFTLSELPL